MTDISYGVVEEIYALGDELRVSYGIAGYSNPESDGTATIVVSIRDVCFDKACILKLINMCNRLSLSTYHLMDVICDLLEG